jgi:hypothetical protein
MRTTGSAAGARRLLIGLAALTMLTGCATLTVVPAAQLADQRLTPAAEPVAHIYAANWGIYLLKYVPLVTGSMERPGTFKFPALFRDEVRVDGLVQKVGEESKKLGGTTLTDLRTRDRSYWLSGFLFPFWLNEFEVSANASR